MTGTLAQLIVLATYGNQFLRTGEINTAFYPDNSTFLNSESVDFREMTKRFILSGFSEKTICRNPGEWLNLLKKEKTQKLHLFFRASEDQSKGPDYKLAGFIGGGGNWMLEQICDGYSYYWQAKWTYNNSSSDQDKRWIVSYARFSQKIKSSNYNQSEERIRDNFRVALSDISSFASLQNFHGWSNTFQKALYELSNLSPGENYYYKDLVPSGDFSVASRQLLYSAAMAWVFGGMGSWNDINLEKKEDEERYDELSAKLYQCITESVLAVVNV
ncbi:MAG TPA: hypothetical protein PKL85_13845 [Bacteroidia bacterium]|nr:hypothetical protein [Bacteroidia bacterium]